MVTRFPVPRKLDRAAQGGRTMLPAVKGPPLAARSSYAAPFASVAAKHASAAIAVLDSAQAALIHPTALFVVKFPISFLKS